MYDELSRTIGGWLDLCGINLIENGVCWPRNELDELSYLRFQLKADLQAVYGLADLEGRQGCTGSECVVICTPAADVL
jgi:hypothetical protein